MQINPLGISLNIFSSLFSSSQYCTTVDTPDTMSLFLPCKFTTASLRYNNDRKRATIEYKFKRFLFLQISKCILFIL